MPAVIYQEHSELIVSIFGVAFVSSFQMCISYYLMPVVSPRAKLHKAFLLVKWEELYVDWTVRLVDCRRFPYNASGVKDLGLRQ